MHPYISQALAAERVADMMRKADAGRLARDARQVVAARRHQSHLSHRARQAFNRQPSPAGLTVTGSQCR